ncbi:MAG: NUDIX hydrolase [Candidatus Palauibacterales bacterium]|nr:NUDIX hydrolase [Candidatus Palauibacterales bacterium]
MSSRPGQESETRRLERQEFERGHIDPGEEPPEPLPAATVVVARAGEDGMEVLLLRRPEETTFAAGAYVFAGGRVDPGDREPELLGRVDAGRADGEPEALVAAARELWEETGLLMARPGAEPDPSRLAAARGELVRGETPFGRLAAGLDLTLPRHAVAYFARWVTPEKLSRRYDTRFFLCRDPGGPVELTGEHTDAVWLRPDRALDHFAAGDLPLLFPTRKTLERLEGFPDAATAIRELRSAAVEAVRPRMLVRDDGVEPVLPGEEGYDDAARTGGE